MVQAIKPISLRDIPKFQIMGQAKHYPDQPRFTSVEHFFNAFENVVKASGNDVNLVWKRYVPLSMAFEYKNWTDNHLLVQKDWESAKDLFRKHFGQRRGIHGKSVWHAYEGVRYSARVHKHLHKACARLRVPF
ncbi:hypothetical protein BD408DRAFT_413294 [Parasitella parasitica]|nr:hypothetical protein BD408DRAFT_413294 [Parasitella parasitica]